MSRDPRLFRFLCTLSLALALAVPLSAATKRRAVKPPPQELADGTVTITGTVRDAVTSEPVIGARVYVADVSAQSDAQGRYTITIPKRTTILTAERRAYIPTQQTYRPAGGTTLDFSLPQTPTVRVRTTDGETSDLDFDSSKFQFALGFSSSSSDAPTFCRAEGASLSPHKSAIRRITGPSTLATVTPCCKDHEVVGINLELKSGEQLTAYFAESCFSDPSFAGIVRRTGLPKFFDFKNVAEITFP